MEHEASIGRDAAKPIEVNFAPSQLEQQSTGCFRNSAVDGNGYAVNDQIDLRRAALAEAPTIGQGPERIERCRRVAGRRQQLDGVNQVLTAAQRSDRFRPIHTGRRPQLQQDSLGDRGSASEGKSCQ